jgi:hypothetical protein
MRFDLAVTFPDLMDGTYKAYARQYSHLLGPLRTTNPLRFLRKEITINVLSKREQR